jgi:hypothetical protein
MGKVGHRRETLIKYGHDRHRQFVGNWEVESYEISNLNVSCYNIQKLHACYDGYKWLIAPRRPDGFITV